METLIKVDPESHMHRWYSVGIQSTLVDGIAVIYGWGSLKSSFQQWRTVKTRSMAEAEKYVEKLVAKKLVNGYQRRCQEAHDSNYVST
jgi:predicted DNA-binding WGR domain protein